MNTDFSSVCKSITNIDLKFEFQRTLYIVKVFLLNSSYQKMGNFQSWLLYIFPKFEWQQCKLIVLQSVNTSREKIDDSSALHDFVPFEKYF